MSKLYIYRCADDTATIYYSKEYPESKGIPVFEYEGDIPEGSGILKTDGTMLYREVPNIQVEPESEPTADELINAFLGVTSYE